MDAELANLVRVTGTPDLIRAFVEEDTNLLSPSSDSYEAYPHLEQQMIPVPASTDVKVNFYATDIGVTQLTNYGLTVEMLRTKAQRQTHIDAVILQTGKDSLPPIT